MAKRRRRNALLAVPPRGIHGLGVAGGRFFQQTVGRPTTPEDYYGVHTTGSEEIAAVYAMGAWSEAAGLIAMGNEVRLQDLDVYPVIISLDVSGLVALPDVDAIARAAFLLDDRSIRNQFEEMYLQEAYDHWEVEYEDVLRAGSDVSAAIAEMQQYSSGPMSAFEDDEAWRRWVETGQYTDDEASRLVDQRRYMSDFEWSRVVRIDAMKPWWSWIIESHTEEGEQTAELVEQAGWKAVDEEMIFDQFGIVQTKTVVRGPAPEANVEYHGTVSSTIRAAFPDIELPPNPFPVQPLDLDELREENPSVRSLKNKLLK